MPQESADCAGSRRPALALLVGLVLMLMAHVVACAVHQAESHVHAAAAASSAQAESTSDVPMLVSDASACSASHGADEHPGHGAACCDPADWPADLRAPAGALLLALLLLGLLPLRHRTEDPATSGAPPGRGDTAGAPSLTGPHLLRLVCVSRT
ncbi:hypothetical protein [Streptomyces sp. WAC00263]|uniref:hypothetical protein n=1 Tax=Streptomyces sp. WAC00263 TaxID=1917422 RepID=UPI0015EFCEC2|nr:hypothetical protein [Streptomyces sp. WAC00263]KAF5990703.1 hypothetical protein BOG92_000630 [Streptomyces sp. WAC00263]